MEQGKRIREMESKLNEAKQRVEQLSQALEAYRAALPQLQQLAAYYDSPDWRQDFEDDCAGKFPPELLRGVLSEDGIYNLLGQTKELREEMAQLNHKSGVTLEDCVRFHGHLCGGITMGYILSTFAMKQLQANSTEALYCRIGFQNCMADAVQCVTGCSVGKKNLEICPDGDGSMILVRRDSGKGVRVKAHFPGPKGQSPQETSQRMMAMDPAELCTVEEVILELPQK